MTPQRRPVAQPLHRQIHGLILERIDAGEWPPGTYLPSETRLAGEYGVSVGTLRKALQDLAQEGVVQRRQGRGTVVATHDGDEVLFRFLNLRRADGSRVRPESRVLDRGRRPASAAERAELDLGDGAEVIHVERLREIDGRAVIHETIALPAARFAALADTPATLPNTLYQLYQRDFAATIHQAEERLTAIAAPAREAALLELAPGTPMLRILRIAADYQGHPLERRLSCFATEGLYYPARL